MQPIDKFGWYLRYKTDNGRKNVKLELSEDE